MKKKIAIFGDSYACWNVDLRNEHLGLSWVEHLEFIYEISNFSRGGSAFQWSYRLFLENKDRFDYCIIVVSAPGRIYIEALENIPNRPIGHFYGQPEYINHLKSITTDDKILKIIDSVEIWYNNWRDHIFEEIHLHELMVNNVLKYDNVLIIPGFPRSVPNYNEVYQNLTDIQYWELLELNPNFDPTNLHCKRKCHLSKENNLILFELVNQAIKRKDKILNLDIKYFKKPPNSLDYYVTI